MATLQPLCLLDILSVPGVDRQVQSFLSIHDGTRLALTCQLLGQQPPEWMLDREILVRLQCPWELRQTILSSPSITVKASSSLLSNEVTAPSVWQALKPILHNRPLKYCYGLKFTIEIHDKTSIDCQVHFPNDVLYDSEDITIAKGMYGPGIKSNKPSKLKCKRELKGCCFGGTYRFHVLKDTSMKSLTKKYYCNACLERNLFCKLHKIALHPASYVVWNHDTTFYFFLRPS